MALDERTLLKTNEKAVENVLVLVELSPGFLMWFVLSNNKFVLAWSNTP